MTTESTAYPDIEIYLKRVETDAVIRWLTERLGSCEIIKQTKSVTEASATYESAILPILIVEKAQGIFTSVHFDSANTPWSSDKDCAREAFQVFSVEIRCNAEGWTEGDDPDEWLSISDEGEQLISWQTKVN